MNNIKNTYIKMDQRISKNLQIMTHQDENEDEYILLANKMFKNTFIKPFDQDDNRITHIALACEVFVKHLYQALMQSYNACNAIISAICDGNISMHTNLAVESIVACVYHLAMMPISLIGFVLGFVSREISGYITSSANETDEERNKMTYAACRF